MTELRLSGSDGIYLFLESSSGDKYRLLIDEGLQNSLKSAVKASKTEVTLTPREIQSEIRSGATVDALVAKTGDPRHVIEKFAAPVLDEISHVVNSALSVQISIAGDRHTDISQIEFGAIIASRLEASGVDEFAWSARRDEQQVWLVSVSFGNGEKGQRATWSFDPKRLLLSPENETAVQLSTQNSLNETKYSPLKPAPELETEQKSMGITETLAETQLVETVIPLGRATEQTEPIAIETEDPLEPPTNLLEALKKKREERTVGQADIIEPEATTLSIEIIDSIGEESQDVEEEITPNPAPVRRTNRPSIPSFDEIVQGTKSEDE